jgi:sugar phosphate isomerase/epimerase
MYISLNSTLTANRVPWPDFAKLAASTGYGGVDVNLGKAMESGVDATRSLLSGLKLKPAIVGLPVEYKKEQADFDRDMQKLDEAARFAAAIGCPRMGTGFFPRIRGRKPNSASYIWSGSAQHANPWPNTV